jgi:hypothetical protein
MFACVCLSVSTHTPHALQVLIVFNARPEPYECTYPPGSDWFKLHPAFAALTGDPAVMACSADNDKKLLRVSPRLAAVFVQPR